VESNPSSDKYVAGVGAMLRGVRRS
jgi:hypothetical protein